MAKLKIIEFLADSIDVIAIAVLVIGLGVATILSARSVGEIDGYFPDKISKRALQVFRISLGRWTLAALGILIVSDILHSIVHRDLEEILYLGGTVAIRVTLAFFLDLEMQLIEKDDAFDQTCKSDTKTSLEDPT